MLSGISSLGQRATDLFTQLDHEFETILNGVLDGEEGKVAGPDSDRDPWVGEGDKGNGERSSSGGGGGASVAVAATAAKQADSLQLDKSLEASEQGAYARRVSGTAAGVAAAAASSAAAAACSGKDGGNALASIQPSRCRSTRGLAAAAGTGGSGSRGSVALKDRTRLDKARSSGGDGGSGWGAKVDDDEDDWGWGTGDDGGGGAWGSGGVVGTISPQQFAPSRSDTRTTPSKIMEVQPRKAIVVGTKIPAAAVAAPVTLQTCRSIGCGGSGSSDTTSMTSRSAPRRNCSGGGKLIMIKPRIEGASVAVVGAATILPPGPPSTGTVVPEFMALETDVAPLPVALSRCTVTKEACQASIDTCRAGRHVICGPDMA